jgi:hypothetical protein
LATKLFRVLALSLFCTVASQMSAAAAQIVLTSTVSGSDTGSATNNNPLTYLSDSFFFNQFDPTLGTLTSAVLQWDFSTSAVVTPPEPVPQGSPDPFTSGSVSFTFLSSSVGGNFFNITSPVTFNFTGPDGSTSLSSALVTGTGTFLAGTLEGILDLGPPTLYPTGVSGSYNGTLTLTYTYTPATPTRVPEPASLLMMGGGFVATLARRRRTRI